MSKLFSVAARATGRVLRQSQRQARRELLGTPLGRILRETQRIGRKSSRAIDRLQMIDRSAASKARRHGSIERYALGDAVKRQLEDLYRALGPMGEVMRGLVQAATSTASLGRQIQSAVKFLEAFGYDVTQKPTRDPGVERALESLSEEVASPEKPAATPPGAPAPPEDRPTPPEDAPPTPPEGRTFEPPSREEEAAFGQEILTPDSSNVYGFSFGYESRRTGILYVTFLAWYPGQDKRSGRGPTYAYFDVSVRKYLQFRRQAQTKSAGGAVWDYLRKRGTVAGHQHQYRLVSGTEAPIPGGVYIPRKLTPKGFRRRALAEPGVGRRGFKTSTLPERLFAVPDRGTPDRGEPQRGA